jgi:protein gp37
MENFKVNDMNRTKIEWTDFTWNPITGCNRACSYCYAKKMALRLKGRSGYDKTNPFAPTFHPTRLNEPLEPKKPHMIFTCSMGDFFDPAVSEEWREAVYMVMDRTPQHTYQVLTKQVPIEPHFRNGFPNNMWFGITIDGTSDYWLEPLRALKSSSATIKFVSFEPVIGDCFPDDLTGISWAIIGAESGNGAKPVNKEHVRKLVNIVSGYQIPLFVKANIQTQLEYSGFDWIDRREFPEIKQVDNTNDVTCVDCWI